MTDVLALILLLTGPSVSIAKVDARSLLSAAVRGPAVLAQSGQDAPQIYQRQIEPTGDIDAKKLLLQVAAPLLGDAGFRTNQPDDEDGGILHLLRPLSRDSPVFGKRYTVSAGLTLKLRKADPELRLSSRLALRLREGNWGDMDDLRDANDAERDLFVRHITQQIDKALEQACGARLVDHHRIPCRGK